MAGHDRPARRWGVRAALVGVVGGIGSGKSAVSGAFVPLGGRVVDGDAVAHRAIRVPELAARVLDRWPGVAAEGGGVDRRALAKVVFADRAPLAALEAIVHPWIHATIRAEIDRHRENPDVSVIALDAAILYETGWGSACDRVLFVQTPRELRQRRVAARGWDAAELARREASQWPLCRKAVLADAAIDNAGPPESAARQVRAWLARWGMIALLSPRPRFGGEG